MGRSRARPREGTLRAAVAVFALAAAAACGGSDGDGPGRADGCAAPALSVLTASGGDERLAVADAGSVVAVHGTGFADGCDDPAGSGEEARTPAPIQEIHLVLVQGSSSREVARVDAGGVDHSFEAPVDVPDGLVAGPAQLRAQRSTQVDDEAIATVELVVGDR